MQFFKGTPRVEEPLFLKLIFTKIKYFYLKKNKKLALSLKNKKLALLFKYIFKYKVIKICLPHVPRK